MTKISTISGNTTPEKQSKNSELTSSKTSFDWTVSSNVLKRSAENSAGVRTQPKNPFDKKAKRKYLNFALAKPLIELDSPLKKQYVKMYYCTNEYVFDHTKNKYTSKRCKTKLCTGCAAIKTAELIRRFEKTLKEEPDLWFLTLTKVSPTKENLKATIKENQNTWRKIVKLAHFHKIELHVIKKLESNYNQDKKTFNPHYHLLIVGKKEANFIRNNWIRLNPTCNPDAQDLKPADTNSIKEVLKYFTKVFKKDKNNKNTFKAHIESLDYINQVFKGQRTFEALGKFRNIPEEELTPEEVEHAYQGEYYIWQQGRSTWVEHDDDNNTLSDNKYYKKLKVKFT